MTSQRLAVFLCVFCLAWHRPGSAQPAYPQNYFHSPLNIPLYLAGNFGEPRSDAFHTGYDLGTNGVEGLPVMAAADGYISRIKVSAFGYGNALYITHPNGYMTLYGHLSRYNDAVAAWVKAQQYAQEQFEVDLYPDSSLFKVKQGEVIAWSGNTGRSGGPHLHFEIRDAAGETSPLNPGLFGITLSDHIKPTIGGVRLYDLDEGFYGKDAIPLALNGWNGSYSLTGGTIPISCHRFCLSVFALDQMMPGGMSYGIYSMRVFLDSSQVFCFQMNRLEFANNRDADAMIDYKLKNLLGQNYYLTARMPDNKNQVFYGLKNDGVIELPDSMPHQVKVEVADFLGNISTLQFMVIRKAGPHTMTGSPAEHPFRCIEPNRFAADSIRITFPKDVLYEDINFRYGHKPRTSGPYSDFHELMPSYTPVHDAFTISILPYFIPDTMRSKAVIMYQKPGGALLAKATQWKDGWLVTQAKDFGSYFVMLDITPPVVYAANFYSGNVLGDGKIIFKMTDLMSGIKSYRGEVDGHWVLMQYDAKSDQLTYQPDESIAKGTHHLKLTVSDQVNNKTVLELQFTR